MISEARVPPEHQWRYGTGYEQMSEMVRHEGAYLTREKAHQAVRLVLAGLGRRPTGAERVDLTVCLSSEIARMPTTQIPVARPLTGWAFAKDLAARTGASPAIHWSTGSALLFGRAELTSAA
ncbi:DUF2267 domain-containing protein [Streptomyces populi]